MSVEGGAGAVICSLSVYCLCVICDNEEDRVDNAVYMLVYRARSNIIIFTSIAGTE